jgi:hypothetical protein
MDTDEVKAVSMRILGNVQLRKLTEVHFTFCLYIDIEGIK